MTAMEGGTTAQKEEGREKFTFPFGGAPFLLLRMGVLFPCSPLGGADFPPLPCWVVPFVFFPKNIF